LTADSKWNQV